MRKFSINLKVPASCDCCGTALPAHESNLARGGEYSLQVPEGGVPTDISIGDGVLIVLGGGKLEVHLRQLRGNQRGWKLKPMYNNDAFGHGRRTSNTGDGSTWYSFSFQLPAFKPWYSTWWAQLHFVETAAFTKDHNGAEQDAHSAATLSVKLETLE